ncbi:MAG: relaxase domain-containing protein [Bryobacteraceae bacterium]|nr:relaxase domain-containing protein [Bryobacteraceae bacterium]
MAACGWTKGSGVSAWKAGVETASFADVLAGRLPDSSVLDPRRVEHRPGLDLAFSAPKSLSLLAILGGIACIVEAVRRSVAATLAWAEKNLAEARVWDPEDRRQQVEQTGKLVAAALAHDFNRNGDPQLHLHVVLANATRASDGQWHALRNDELYRARHLLGAIHNAELRAGRGPALRDGARPEPDRPRVRGEGRLARGDRGLLHPPGRDPRRAGERRTAARQRSAKSQRLPPAGPRTRR